MRTRNTSGSGGGGDKHEIVTTTQTALRNLRDAGGLEMNKIYKFPVDDVDGAGVVCMTPLDANTLPSNAHWEHPTLTAGSAWPTAYDIDTGLMEYLHDTVNDNHVYSHESINNFPFGVAAVSENTIHSRAGVDYVSGTFTQNVVGSESFIDVEGTVDRNVIGQNAQITVEGVLRDSHIGNNSNVDAGGTVDRVQVGTNGTVQVDAGASLNDSRVDGESNLIMNGGSLGDSKIAGDSTVTIIGGTNYENTWDNSVVFTQVGTGYFRYSTFEGNTTMINGNVNIANSKFNFTPLNTTGSTGTIVQSHFDAANLNNTQNIASLTISGSSLSDYTQLSATGAARLYIYRSDYSSNARVLVSAGARIDSSYDSLDSYGYLQATAGVLLSTYNNVSSRSYIQNVSPGTNRASRVHASGESKVRFLNTVDDCRIYYSNADSYSNMEHRGTSTGCYIYYSNAQSRAQMYTNNSVNARMYYNDATANGKLYSQANTATHYIYYSSADSNGTLAQIGNSADTRIYGSRADSQGILQLRNTAVGIARLYYSSVTAYYYLYVTKTVGNVTSALHGYGRLTNSVTDPANGTSVDNF